MDDTIATVSEILHDAAETHHVVFAIVDGDDADWATWYSEWLLSLSKLPEVLGKKPVRSELTFELVRLDKEHAAAMPDEPWERYYARELIARFSD